MSAGTLISLEEYLHTAYSPDREYRDGMLVERNVGDHAHGRLQALLAAYLIRREQQWNIEVCTEVRIRVRTDWYPIPDVCVFSLPAPPERFPSTMPLLWVEILSRDDKMVDVWDKADELLKHQVPNVWIINPNTLSSELRTQAGITPVTDKTLRVPNSPIVIPLLDVMTGAA
jgi:Uma2 family endonuclease